MLCCGLILSVAQFVTDSPGAGVVFLVVFAVLAALLSPWAFPRSISDAQAQRRSAEDGRPIIYWRPGCPYCMRLRAVLGRDTRRAHWVDIWSDPEGAAAVRVVTGGDETVPTVVAGTESFVNPDPRLLRARLRAGWAG
jgi:mycoredoxin